MMFRQLPLIGSLALLVMSSAALAQSAPSDTLRLSLEDAVTTGLRVADEVRLSDAQADVADAQYDVARAGLLPQIRLNSTYTRTFESARGNAVGAVFNQPNTYGANANVSQTIFQGGRLVATARAASSVARAARLDAQEARAAFTVSVQRAYFGALLANRMVELQETNLELSAARLAQVQQFQAAGRAAQYDVLRARVEHANIEPVVIQARNDRDIAYLQLKQLLNVPVTQPLVLTSAVDLDAAQTMVVALLDSSVSPERPALRSAELIAQSRRLAISAARADFLPTVTAFFQTGYQAFPLAGTGLPTQRGTLANQFCPAGSAPERLCQNSGWFEDRSMGLQFSWPIFDGLRSRSALEAARALSYEADVSLRQARERVNVEVALARAELQRARAAFNGRRQTSSEATEAFHLASLRFSRGLSTQLEVSDAQLALLTAESAEARATYDLYLATAELARALGRPIPMPATTTSPRSSND